MLYHFPYPILVPKEMLIKCLVGGKETVSTLEYLGLLFPCELDSSMMVPYVHLVPIDVDIVNDLSLNESQLGGGDIESKQKSIILVTDSHPTVLSRTTVGEMEDGAVMYIGPDSLSLVNSLPLQFYVSRLHHYFSSGEHFKILDICCGSGVQGISTLISLKESRPNASAVFVDVNDRALRFVRFNALLNGIQDDRILTVKTDITRAEEDCAASSDYFDIILANPPFIPTPTYNDLIAKRYGLFSSGGYSGEEVLRAIIAKSPSLLRPGVGLMAIVSEFMNPPQEGKDIDVLQNIQNWWESSTSKLQLSRRIPAKGVLFTNQYPVASATYAARRADNECEFDVWSNHLKSCGINAVSPGLLFVQLCTEDETRFESVQVPKSILGSIWTPSNIYAVQYIKQEWRRMLD